jgi:hypothetical protein
MCVMQHRHNGSSTVQRNADGTFGSGNSGRKKESRHKVTLAIEALIDGQAAQLTQTVLEKALKGDMVALKMCMERIMPT